MQGSTNAVIATGGSGGNAKTYGVDFAYDYAKDILNNSVTTADKTLLNVLDVSGVPAKLAGSWEYKPADLREYLQNILTCDNVAAWKILARIKTGVQVLNKTA